MADINQLLGAPPQPNKAMIVGGVGIGILILAAPLIVLFIVVRLAVRD